MMYKLLKEWAELEGDRCLHHKDGAAESIQVLIGEQFTTAWAANPSAGRLLGSMFVHAALQGAIDAHDWLFSLENTTKGRFYAKVYASRDEQIASDKNKCQGEGMDAAESLLMAYLTCLKGIAMKGGES